MIRRWFDTRVERPINIPELLKSAAIVLLGASSLIAVLVVNDAKTDEKARADLLADELKTSTDTQDCRSLLASNVTDATTTFLFAMGQDLKAIGDLVVQLANDGDIAGALEALTAAGQGIDSAGVSLDDRRDRRVRFEEQPGTVCPRTPNASGPTTTTVPPPATTSTSRRSATTGPAVSSTTRPTATTVTPSTTDPPTPLCDLVPISIPREIPCL